MQWNTGQTKQASDSAPALSLRDLSFQLEVTAAILRSLDIDQVLYVVLSGVTSGEGLAFNRALFMLVDEGQRALRTSMAIGPVGKAEAHRIWEDMKAKDLTLPALLASYEQLRNDPTAHALTQRLGHLQVPMGSLEELAKGSADPGSHGQAPIGPMIARCLQLGQPMFSDTLELVCDQGMEGQDPLGFRRWGMVPLQTPEHDVGLLVVDNAFMDRSISLRERTLLEALGDLTAIAVEKQRLFSRMRALAEVDGLTGVANRRTYDEALARMLTEARQTGRTVSLVLIDVDHFKLFNDEYGHLAGDDALRNVASILQANARRSDLVARYGGEEFAVVLPDAGVDQALVVAHKLVRAVRESGCTPHGHITISAGVAESEAGILDATQLFEQADRAVYEAKRAGRNQVKLAPASETTS